MVQARLLSIAYRLQRWVWKKARPRTRGVKVMLFTARRELILIRNAYGRSDLFVLPGGGIRPFEQAFAAAAREVREELGLEVAALRLRSMHRSAAEGKRDEIYLFEGKINGQLRTDAREVAEAIAVDIARLPSNTSPATRRRIEEYLGQRVPDGCW